MVFSGEFKTQIYHSQPGEISAETGDVRKADHCVTENGCTEVTGSSGTVYLSKRIKDPILGETDYLIPGQSEDPMTID